MIEECENGMKLDKNGTSFAAFALLKAEGLIHQEKFAEAEVSTNQ